MSIARDNRGLRALVDAGEEVIQIQREQIAVLTERLSRLLTKLKDIKAVGQYCDNDSEAALTAVVVILRITKAAISDELASLKEESLAEAERDASCYTCKGMGLLEDFGLQGLHEIPCDTCKGTGKHPVPGVTIPDFPRGAKWHKHPETGHLVLDSQPDAPIDHGLDTPPFPWNGYFLYDPALLGHKPYPRAIKKKGATE